MKKLTSIYIVLFTFSQACFGAGELEVGGMIRTRFETLDGQYRAKGSQSDQQLANRAELRARYSFSKVELVTEIINSSTAFTDTGSKLNTGMTNTLEPVQAYIAFRPDSNTRLQAGRFTLDLGSRRLVARNIFRNSSNSFLGVLAERQLTSDLKLTAFLTQPSILLPAERTALEDNKRELDDHTSALRFWGLSLAGNVNSGALVEGYFMGLREKDSAKYNTPNRHLNTAGLRIGSPKTDTWQYQAEVMYQWGRRRANALGNNTTDQNVSAEMVHLDASYSMSGKQKLRLAFDYASGDRSANDGSYNRFDTLYGPSVPDFGFTGIYGAIARANLISPELRWTLSQDNWNLMLAYRPVWLASTTDSFGRSGVRDATGESGQFAAQQLLGRLRMTLKPQRWNAEFGMAYLRAEEFLVNAPNSSGNRNTLYSFGMVTYSF